MRVSFDYDDCLGDLQGMQALAAQYISCGHDVYVLSARDPALDNRDLYQTADALGILRERVLLCCDAPKASYCAKHHIDIHFDDDAEECEKISAACCGTAPIHVKA